MKKYLPYLLILAVSIGLYSNTFEHDFVLDDMAVLAKNDFVRNGIKGIPDIFSSTSWKGFAETTKEIDSYRPFSFAHFAVEHEFFGTNPHAYHIVQVLYFALLCLLIYRLFGVFLRDKSSYLPLVIALLFAAHPIHTDVVANIKSRDELFVLFFGVLACSLLFHYLRSKGVVWLILASLSYFVALLSKENAITFVAVFPLCMYFFSQQSLKQIARYTIPFLLAAALFLLIRYQMLADMPERVYRYFENPLLLAETTSQWLGMRFYGIGKCLQLLLFPHPLTSSYFYNDIPVVEVWEWRSWLSVLAYLALGGILLKFLQKKHLIAFGLLLYFINYSVYSNLIVQASDFLGERWLFSPSLGFIVALAAGLFLLVKKHETRDLGQFFAQNAVFTLVFALILGLYSYKTFTRNAAWKDSYTLAKTDIQTSPNSQLLNSLLPTEMIKRYPTDKAKLREALVYFDRAVRMRPEASVWNNVGATYHFLGQYDSAALAYQKALKLNQKHRDSQLGLVDCLVRLGKYQNALQLILVYEKDPRLQQKYKLFANKGVAYGNLSQFENAIQSFHKAIALFKQGEDAQEGLVDIYMNLAMAYRFAQNYDAAIKYYKEFQQLAPKDIRAYNGLALSYFLKKDYQNAVVHFKNALKLNPNLADLYKNIAVCYQNLGDEAQKQAYWNEYQKRVKK